MGKMKAQTRNKVFPFRATDEEANLIVASVPLRHRSTFFREAVLEKIRAGQQTLLDAGEQTVAREISHYA